MTEASIKFRQRKEEKLKEEERLKNMSKDLGSIDIKLEHEKNDKGVIQHVKPEDSVKSQNGNSAPGKIENLTHQPTKSEESNKVPERNKKAVKGLPTVGMKGLQHNLKNNERKGLKKLIPVDNNTRVNEEYEPLNFPKGRKEGVKPSIADTCIAYYNPTKEHDAHQKRERHLMMYYLTEKSRVYLVGPVVKKKTDNGDIKVRNPEVDLFYEFAEYYIERRKDAGPLTHWETLAMPIFRKIYDGEMTYEYSYKLHKAWTKEKKKKEKPIEESDVKKIAKSIIKTKYKNICKIKETLKHIYTFQINNLTDDDCKKIIIDYEASIKI